MPGATTVLDSTAVLPRLSTTVAGGLLLFCIRSSYTSPYMILYFVRQPRNYTEFLVQ